MWREAYLKDIRRTYRKYRELAESAIAQVDDTDLHRSLDDEDNSIAIVMQHVAGNLRSRFSGFLVTDGEKGRSVCDTQVWQAQYRDHR